MFQTTLFENVQARNRLESWPLARESPTSSWSSLVVADACKAGLSYIAVSPKYLVRLPCTCPSEVDKYRGLFRWL